MTYHTDDTICAIASAPGGAARGIVRLSGADAIAVVERLFEPSGGMRIGDVRRPTIVEGSVRIELNAKKSTNLLPASHFQREEFRRVPCGLYVWPTTRSYTREPVAELHTIGSPPLLELLVAMLCRAGARLAEAGEFTLRAFLAGRIDLTQAEAVLGLIEASGESQRGAALAQLAGGLTGPMQRLRDDLLQLLADLEAGLDFVEEDIEFITTEELQRRLEAAHALLDGVGDQMTSRYTTNCRLQVVFIGEPNVGKSSLFNAFNSRYGVASDHTAALVSNNQGTTRDYLTAAVAIDGQSVEIIDTAGVNVAAVSVIETAAQTAAAERRERASIRAWCIDASTLTNTTCCANYCDCELVVLTKSDLATDPNAFGVVQRLRDIPVVVTSSRTGEGLDALATVIGRLLSSESASQSGQVLPATADRCRDSIRLAQAAVQRAGELAKNADGEELIAAELRTALSELGKVVGAVYTDDLLDRIFSTFCIGK